MPCYHPLRAWQSAALNVNGKRSIYFKGGYRRMPVTISCGSCIGCRIERSRQWAVRLMHEASLHLDNSFITLTYGPEFVPPGGTLLKKHFQDFMKRLRKHYEPKLLRFFHCGEYGEITRRPHYHAILFGVRFDDQRKFKTSPNGSLVYTSATLTSLWGMGHCTVGEVTYESAAYVARYVLKKMTGDAAAEHYQIIDPDTGEIFQLQPEYITMSLKPGIASGWFEEFSSDVFPSDTVVMNGKQMKPPRYYDKKLDEETCITIKEKRAAFALTRAANNTPERLAVREEVTRLKLSQFKREPQ